MFPRITPFASLAALVLIGLTACDQTSGLLEPGEPRFSSLGPVLVECPSDETISAEGTIGSTGGSVKLGKHSLTLPMQAVKGPHTFSVTDQASNYVVLDLRGNGQESFGFGKPASITIDYSRCTRSNIDKGPLSVWKVDPVSKALLKHMGGIDDKTARSVTFTTDSLSVYSIAN